MEPQREQWLSEYLSSHPKFQEKNLLKSRVALSQEILSLDLPEERRSWLLHRLTNAHSPQEVTELIAQVLC